MYTRVVLVILIGVICVSSRSIMRVEENKRRSDDDKSEESVERHELKKIPHRIYLAGHDIIEGFGEPKRDRNVDMTFTYELVEPNSCQIFKPTFGCCWDNRTVAVGPHGEGCPLCMDKKKSCTKWTDYCHVGTIREVCPQSCHACPKKKNSTCQDDPSQEKYCAIYSRFGLCKKSLKIRNYCKSTCGACGLLSFPPK